MKVLNGKKVFNPGLDPLFLPEKLTLRTMPVSAGVVGYRQMPAGVTLIHMTAECCCSADLDGTHGAQLI
jgi:hypothetical protein